VSANKHMRQARSALEESSSKQSGEEMPDCDASSASIGQANLEISDQHLRCQKTMKLFPDSAIPKVPGFSLWPSVPYTFVDPGHVYLALRVRI
jgi:hypothetical protein